VSLVHHQIADVLRVAKQKAEAGHGDDRVPVRTLETETGTRYCRQRRPEMASYGYTIGWEIINGEECWSLIAERVVERSTIREPALTPQVSPPHGGAPLSDERLFGSLPSAYREAA
jgi:hypothetical protein